MVGGTNARRIESRARLDSIVISMEALHGTGQDKWLRDSKIISLHSIDRLYVNWRHALALIGLCNCNGTISAFESMANFSALIGYFS